MTPRQAAAMLVAAGRLEVAAAVARADAAEEVLAAAVEEVENAREELIYWTEALERAVRLAAALDPQELAFAQRCASVFRPPAEDYCAVCGLERDWFMCNADGKRCRAPREVHTERRERERRTA